MANNTNNAGKWPKWFPVMFIILVLLAIVVKSNQSSSGGDEHDAISGGGSGNISSIVDGTLGNDPVDNNTENGGGAIDSNAENDILPSVNSGSGNSGELQQITDELPDKSVLSAVPEHLRNNYFLNRKEKGCCKTLSGKVAVAVVMISDSVGQWDNESVSRLQTTLQAGGQDIAAEAAAYQVDLSFSFHYYNAQMTGDICSGDYSNDWQNPALQSAGLPSLDKLHNYLVQTHSAKEAPVVFVFNKTGRAYASNGANEFFVLFAKEKNDGFQHELSHVFGGKDYYYPAEVKTLASGCFPDSVMNKGKTADPLTAYLIGWTDTVADNALQFLQSTNGLTAEYMRQAVKEEAITGYGTKIFDTGTYTGDLVRGECHGTGTMQYNNGGWYTGQWNSNSWTGAGTGKVIYDDGDVYEGEFLNGKRHGSGTYYYSNGGWYKGQWKDGSKTGSGTGKMIYDDGDIYEGELLNGKRHGSGTYNYSDGGWYKGQWKDGSKAGSGTGKLIYDNGGVYEGELLEGKRHGTGTYHYPDGAVYNGAWVSGKRQGTGTIQYTNGGWYTGNWDGDKQAGAGKGKQIYSNGVYEGELYNGKRHGQGTYVWSGGDRYTGQWNNGERHGYGSYTKADGRVTTGTWKNGQFVE